MVERREYHETEITAMILTTFAISTVIPATAFASSYEDMSDLQTKYEQHLEKYNLSSEELPPPSDIGRRFAERC